MHTENSLGVWAAVKRAPRERGLLILEGLLRVRLNNSFLYWNSTCHHGFTVSLKYSRQSILYLE
jgi:hypothetical protein